MFLLEGLINAPTLNEHQLAWEARDWEKVKELADSFKESPESELFANLNAINYTKEVRSIDDSYSKFLINELLSLHTDALYPAYMANLSIKTLRDVDHFRYLLHTVPRAKRYASKTKLNDDIKHTFIIRVLMCLYDVNETTAHMYKSILIQKGKLESDLKRAAAYVTDDFLKSITKNVKTQKELRKLL